MTSHLVFVYGTLKRGEPNFCVADRPDIGSTEFVSTAVSVECWPMVTSPEYYNTPFVLNKKGTGKIIQGELFRVDDAMLKELDRLEDHPHFYERHEHEFEISDGQIIRAGIYLMTNHHPIMETYLFIENYSAKIYAPYVPPRERTMIEEVLEKRKSVKLTT